MQRLAVVLFNLGGPDRPEAVEPFLFNLFSDPAILRLPGLLRRPLARLISRRRAPVAREIYAEMGGRSPIVPETEAQSAALQTALDARFPDGETRIFMAMRYWHPRASETVAAVKAFAPDEIVLLPLYPQFSTTTSASSLAEWRQEADHQDLRAPVRAVCCYPRAEGFLAAHRDLLTRALAEVPETITPRVLFSAHGLPERVVRAGDPYQWQVEETVAGLLGGLDRPGLDSVICYQSRVGPLKWIGPSTEDEIVRAAEEGRGIVVVPIAFVSEHSETLVELDIEYRDLADKHGAPHYVRVPALGVTAPFIEALAGIVAAALDREGIMSDEGARVCPHTFGACPMQQG